MPAFDNNVFENSSDATNFSKINKLLNGKDNPLLDRVIGGRYSPGSTIKPLLALAGLKEGVVTPSTTINATGSIKVQSEVDPSVFYTFRDWRVHGWTDIKKAIADSVDVFFYALGGGYGNISGLGIDRIENYLKIFRADKETGIDLPGEMSGLVPSKNWKEATKGESWYVGDTYNISIGQGDLDVTPIWLNTYVGSIANGGKLMKPFVVKEVRDSAGDTIGRMSPQVLGETPFDQQTVNIVRQGMRQTVLSGTAILLQDLPAPVAAKTGTAQVPGRGLNSLFTVFGPYDNPEIVMTVLVENINQSQGLAIRVANEFLLWYFSEFRK
jgi:penicillin-binding protein 2